MSGAEPQDRLRYLDTIRGLAAIQVLLLHLLSGFAPALVFDKPSDGTWGGAMHASPLFFTYDGYSAVYIFFVLSGYVLTGAFARQVHIPSSALVARLVRLGLPALASCVLAAGLFAIVGGHNMSVGRLVESPWYSRLWHPDPGVSAVLRDGVLNALFIGYEGGEPMTSLVPWLVQPISESYNAPLWTLSIELYGSVLVFALCWLKARSRTMWLVTAGLAALFLLRSHYICFVVGHGLAAGRRAERPPFIGALLALFVLAAGIFACVLAEFWQPAVLDGLCDTRTRWLFPCQSTLHQQKAYGALLVFVALTQLSSVRRVLSRPRLEQLGHLSFPVYLVHWPILFGVSALVFVVLHPALGVAGARPVAMLTGLALTVVAAVLFRPVDGWAVRLSRKLRSGA